MKTQHSFQDLVSLLNFRASEHPDRVAYIFLGDTGQETQRLTYGELHARALQLATSISQVAKPGSRAVLLFQPGLEFIQAFFACLYAGVIAVPAYPPRLNRNLNRLESILKDAQPSLALTTQDIKTLLLPIISTHPLIKHLPVLATDIRDQDGWDENLLNRPISGETLAFLQYTSGSTGNPKGVMVSHGNLIANERMITESFGMDETSVVVGWLPLYHDMGLIGNVLQPLTIGSHAVLFSPVTFLQDPFIWLQAITKYRAHTSGGPNFAYDLCVRKISQEKREQLDLSTWDLAFNGAEPIHHATLDRFSKHFAPYGFRTESFYPCYGLAEATLFVTGVQKGIEPIITSFDSQQLEKNKAVEGLAQGESRPLVSCGWGTSEQDLLIVHPESKVVCQDGDIGEVWVRGPHVAKGYWRRQEETVHTFEATLMDGSGPFLRTGDLAFKHADQLYMTGRLKDLIIIRGRNHYPQDIERTAEQSCRGLRPGCGAAFSVDIEGSESLVYVVESEPKIDPSSFDAVFQSVRKAIADNHDLRLHTLVLIRAGSLPKTSSGKIQRRETRQLLINSGLNIVWSSAAPVQSHAGELPAIQDGPAPLKQESADPVRALTRSLQEWVGRILKMPSQQVHANESLAAYGLDSLATMELKSEIENQFKLEIPFSFMLEGPSCEELAQKITEQLGKRSIITTSEEEPESAAADSQLSHGQEALWLEQELQPNSSAYNIPFAMWVPSFLSVAHVRWAFEEIVRRHPVLNSHFVVKQEHTVMVPSDRPLDIEEVNAESIDPSALRALVNRDAERAFFLHKETPLRIRFYQSQGRTLLLFCVHHIVFDLWSIAILFEEFQTLLKSKFDPQATLPEPKPYAAFVKESRAWVKSKEGEAQLDFWKKTLAGDLPILTFPLASPRKPFGTRKAAAFPLSLDSELTGKVRALAAQYRTTCFNVLLASYQLLLHAHTGQPEVMVGIPTAGRRQKHSLKAIGYFVNPVCVRSRFEAQMPFVELLNATSRATKDALDHQDYPFPLLVKNLNVMRNHGSSPIFQTMFAYQAVTRFDASGFAAVASRQHGSKLQIGPLPFENFALEHVPAQFDIALNLFEEKDRIAGAIEYDVSLFENWYIKLLGEQWMQLLRDFVSNPDLRVMDALQDETRPCLPAIDDSMDRLSAYFDPLLLRADKGPAVEIGSLAVSREALMQKTDRLAEVLAQKGIGPECVVGLLMKPGLAFLESLLSIWKAGAVALPLDREAPAERNVGNILDSGCSLILGDGEEIAVLSNGVPTLSWIELEKASEKVLVQAKTWLGSLAALMIYTSGSTGKPKGVVLTRNALADYVPGFLEQTGVHGNDRILQFHSTAFDAAYEEILFAIASGSTLVIPEERFTIPGPEFVAMVRSLRISILDLPTSFWHELVRDCTARQLAYPDCVRLQVVGGDALRPDAFIEWTSLVHGSVKLLNTYGPTEATISVSSELLSAAQYEPQHLSSIGRSFAHTQVYIANEELNPLKSGMLGEIVMTGSNLARAYHRLPAMTADRFRPHPNAQFAGQRVYRSGDLGIRLPDGRIRFVGRSDSQVKIRGYRIELGEIEAALLLNPTIQQAVSKVHSLKDGHKEILAYIVPQKEALLDITVLKAELKQRLPQYMIPHDIVVMQELPKTISGKIDIRALTIPNKEARPRTLNSEKAFDLEDSIRSIWCELLSTDDVGLEDNFFDLGGHSLLITQLRLKLEQQLSREIPLMSLFENPTVSSLATYLQSTPEASESASDEPLSRKRSEGMTRRDSRRRAQMEDDIIQGH